MKQRELEEQLKKAYLLACLLSCLCFTICATMASFTSFACLCVVNIPSISTNCFEVTQSSNFRISPSSEITKLNLWRHDGWFVQGRVNFITANVL